MPSFMFSSIKEENARAVYKAALRVQKGIPCAFNELLFTDLRMISNTVKTYLFQYVMPLNRFLNQCKQQNYFKTMKQEFGSDELPCYLCNFPVSFVHNNASAAKFYAKVCYMKCVDRSLKYATIERVGARC